MELSALTTSTDAMQLGTFESSTAALGPSAAVDASETRWRSSAATAARTKGQQTALAMRAYQQLSLVFILCLVLVAVLTSVGLATNIGALNTIYGNLRVLVYLLVVYINWQGIAIDCYFILAKASVNATALATGARDIATKVASFNNSINALQYGNATLAVPVVFNDTLAPVFAALHHNIEVTKDSAAHLTAAAANGTTTVTPEVAADVDMILAQNALLQTITPLYRQVSAVTLEGFQTATVEQYVFACVILAVLLMAIVIILWPLRKYMRNTSVAIAERNQKLDQLADEMAALARLSPNGIFYTNEEGKVVSANAQWLSIAGLTQLGPDADTWLERVHADDRAAVQRAWQCVQSERGAAFEAEFRLIRPDGSVVWAYGQCQPDVGAQAGRRRIVAAFTDITQRKALERERLDALERAAAVQDQRVAEAALHRREQERFVDVMCHEIRNPLNGIVNNIDLLRASWARARQLLHAEADPRSGLDDTCRGELLALLAAEDDMLAAIDVCAKHQRRISEDMLHLSRLHSGQFPIEPRPFAATEVLVNATRMFAAEAAALHIDLRTSASDRLSPDLCLVGDAQRVHQIVTNLLSNALKFTQHADERRVEVHLDVEPAEADPDTMTLLVAVTDTGIGMTPEQLAAIVLPFGQASAKTFVSYSGSGMGLFICKALLDLMHGTLDVRSEPGRGTTFTVRIPCTRALPVPPVVAMETQVLDTRRPQHVRILVVDDNEINRTVLRRQLVTAADVVFEVECATNGEEAVQASAAAPFDLILMDVEMPVMNGLDATACIRRRERDQGNLRGIPIIGISGNARQEHFELAQAAGMTDYVAKPYDKKALIERILRTIRLREQ